MRSIIPDDLEYRCYLCGKVGTTQVHHMLHGSYRKNADQFGLTVHLCPHCHRALHDKRENDLFLQKTAQRKFEQSYSHNDFMKIFGRNWL